MRVVYYSLSFQGGSADLFRLQQLTSSIQSLRRHNTTVPVRLHLLGNFPSYLAHMFSPFGVDVVDCGDYAGLIDRHLPGAGQWLAHYPVLHKFLTVGSWSGTGTTQALYLDTDTFILADIETLFDRYSQPDIVAREEPGSRLSPLGYLPDYLDEDRLYELAAGIGAAPVRPFNSGVMLMNNRIWERLFERSRLFLELVAAQSLWMELHCSDDELPEDVRFLRANRAELASVTGTIAPLPFPGSNLWIKEQVACWLVLGLMGTPAVACFDRQDVLQGCEEVQEPGRFARPVVSHYYSRNTAAFFAQMQNPTYRD